VSQPFLAQLEALHRTGRKALALLIDPDRFDAELARRLLSAPDPTHRPDFVFVGGSLVGEGDTDTVVRTLRTLSPLPVVLFPGDVTQLSDAAHAILFLSLISGRNPDLLIGRHVQAAPRLQRSGLEVVPTGYMIVDAGRPTSASYMSGTAPLPANKPDIAAYTALAGYYLGLRALYIDAGSGAAHSTSPDLVQAVRHTVPAPIIVGGGIREPETALALAHAGADVLVVGSAAETDPTGARLAAIAQTLHSLATA